VACHRLPGDPELESDTRISLAHVRAKYRPAALADFLQRPSRSYQWTRMPDFQLAEAEAEGLAAFLVTQGEAAPAGEDSASSGDVARGRELATTAGCANCHELDLPLRQPPALTLDQLRAPDWASGCLADTEVSRRTAPAFHLDAAELAALRGFLHRDVDALRQTVWPEFAEHHLKSLRCTACHEREDAKDFWFSLEASTAANQKAPANPYDEEDAQDQTIHRQRPPLTWAGEKLRPEWLESFLSGQVLYKPRPKLVARMPAFPAFAGGMARGLAMQHGNAPNSPSATAADLALAKTGEALIRKGAFGCVDCHAVGTQAALAGTDTVTINFAYIPERLRKEYYDRYLRDPQRYLPGTMMPKFVGDDGQTGITLHFAGDPQRQFEAIWNFLRTVPPPPLP
jgi:mono/diheme cytochrome c family protein